MTGWFLLAGVVLFVVAAFRTSVRLCVVAIVLVVLGLFIGLVGQANDAFECNGGDYDGACTP